MIAWIGATCRRLAATLAVAAALLWGGGAGAEETIRAQLGVTLTPANFPHQSGEDIAAMYQRASAIGKISVINCRWSDPECPSVAEKMMRLDGQFKLQAVIALDVLVEGGVRLAPPGGGSARRLEGDSQEAYYDTVRRLAALHPAMLEIGVDVNRLLADGPPYLAAFAESYKHAYDLAKSASPNTKVFVSFNWDIFDTAAAEHNVPVGALKPFVDLFRPKLDVLAFTSVPSEKFKSPSKTPAGYYARIADLSAGEPVLLQLGWPSGNGGEAGQADFVKSIPGLLGGLDPKWLTWLTLHDLPVPGSPVATLGLYSATGGEKPAAKAFRALAGARANAQPEPVARKGKGEVEPVRQNPDDRFAIYTNSLAGDDPKLLVSDPSREINHAHFSPDRSRLVFTRFNVRDADGVALETTSYFETEIVLCSASGRDCAAVIPAASGKIAANASWTPDGRGLLFITTDTPTHRPAIARYDLESGRIEPFTQAAGLDLADPHMVRGQTVVTGSANDGGAKLSRVYVVKGANTIRPLTNPKIANFRALDPPLGDHDPKLSPDGSHVALMRHIDKDEWHIVVVDVASGAETDISEPGAVDAVPEWSSDGNLIAFWHVDPKTIKNSGIYVARADGSERRRVPLPHGFFYTMPVFIPGKKDGILYSAQIKAGM